MIGANCCRATNPGGTMGGLSVLLLSANRRPINKLCTNESESGSTLSFLWRLSREGGKPSSPPRCASKPYIKPRHAKPPKGIIKKTRTMRWLHLLAHSESRTSRRASPAAGQLIFIQLFYGFKAVPSFLAGAGTKCLSPELSLTSVPPLCAGKHPTPHPDRIGRDRWRDLAG